MKRSIFVALLLLSTLLSLHSEPGIATIAAVEYAERESKHPGDTYNDPPSFVAEGWNAARVATIPYSEGAEIDVYWPARTAEKPLPVILTVFKYTVATFIQSNGKPFRTMVPTIIWMSQLANLGYVVACPDITGASGGMARIMAWIGERGPSLGMDPSRIGLLAFSANAGAIPPLLRLPEAANVKAVMLYYPLVVPSEWSLGRDVALHVVKAGKDDANLNKRLDVLVQAVRDAGNIVDLVTCANGRHAFDLKDKSAEAAAAMASTHAFVQAYLR